MNWIDFIWLINNIYGKNDKPDLDKIQKMGLLAVKIGQVHALRIDFLSEKKCRHLSKLYRQAVIIPPEKSLEIMEKYAVKGFIKKFSFIEQKPFASASVGQVHKAKFIDGSNVIIKVIKDDFKKKFIADVNSVRKLFKFIIFFYPKLSKVADPVGVLENIAEYTLTELDLINELHGQQILSNIYAEYSNVPNFKRLRFAKIYKNLSNSHILVSEFITGQTYDELLEQKRLSYKDLLELFNIHGFYMFAIGTFHGDIHPGNIIKNGKNIYLVDTSAINHASLKTRRSLLHFFIALADADYDECVKWLMTMAKEPLTKDKSTKFRDEFIKLYDDFHNKTVSQLSLTKRMMETIKLAVNNGMEFDKDIFPIIKSLMYMDGMVLRCNPDAVLINDVKPFMIKLKSYLNSV